MGFAVQRVTTGSGKGKSAYSYLVSIPEEKRMVQRLYELFRMNRSIQTTAKQMNIEGYQTPSGAEFNTSTTKLVLRNPIYCTADKCSYNYFMEHDGNLFGELTDFDGQHGLSAYNKTDQEKYEDSEHFKEILEIKMEEVWNNPAPQQEYSQLKRKREKLQTDIVAQTRNMREVDESIRCYLQEDIQSMSEELRETERRLFKLDESRKNNMVAIRDLEQTKERLLSFAEYAKDAQPEVLVTLIQTIVERIYIVDKDDERYCHIFIKGCTDEDYTGFFQTAGYIEHSSAPVCDSEQYCVLYRDITKFSIYPQNSKNIFICSYNLFFNKKQLLP